MAAYSALGSWCVAFEAAVAAAMGGVAWEARTGVASDREGGGGNGCCTALMCSEEVPCCLAVTLIVSDSTRFATGNEVAGTISSSIGGGSRPSQSVEQAGTAVVNMGFAVFPDGCTKVVTKDGFGSLPTAENHIN